MIYKNTELHNVAELMENGDGSVSWRRLPSYVYDVLEAENGKLMAENSTGVEMRFVLRGDRAVIKMSTSGGYGSFRVFRGGIQGSWEDEKNTVVTEEVREYVIEKSRNTDKMKKITDMAEYDWNCEVIRIIFDCKAKIYDVVGDIEPPKDTDTPKMTIMSYGSSITHGSNAMGSVHSWVSVLAHNLNADYRNLGMAGSCFLEPKMAEYIAAEGKSGKWDIATLELGINVLEWGDEKIVDRVENLVGRVAGENPEKPVFVISPFYHCGDDFDENDRAKVWRKLIEQTVERLNLRNVTYVNGLDVLGDCSYISADEVHPNVYGVKRIADKIEEIIKSACCVKFNKKQ